MQLTPAQRRFYIDPVQDTTLPSDKILVLEERAGRNIYLDKIVTVKPKRAAIDFRQWWVTEQGDYVHGAPVNPNGLLSYQRIISIGGDGWCWLGTPNRRVTDGYLCSSLRRSDGRQLPGTGNTGAMTMELPEVVRAAPWADELFPSPADTDAVVRAKLGLAEQRWKHRHAKAEIIRQGINRNWHDDLRELRESGKLPAATYGVLYSGTVMIDAMNPPSADSLSVRDSARLAEMRERVNLTDASMKVMLGIDIDLPLTLRFDDYDDARKANAEQVKDAVRAVVGDYTAIPGEHHLTPVLRSVA